jgi:hypothetical protein
MRLLILSVSFYPEETPHAIRWKRLAEAMAEAGHDLWVLSRRMPGLPDESQWGRIRIIRTGRVPLGIGLKPKPGEPPARPNLLLAFLVRIRNASWKKVWWPDASVFWLFHAYRQAVWLIREKPIDRMYTLSLPFTSHLAGYLIKQKFPDLPWFADHGDPFSVEGVIPQNNHRLYIRLNERADRLIARKADCHFVNTPALKAHFSRLAGEGIRILEVPHPLPPGTPGGTQGPEHGICYLDYFGALFSGERSPEAFFRFLEAFFLQVPAWRDQLRIRFFGPVSPEAVIPGKMPDYASWMGNLPHAAVAERIGQSSVLLSLGYANPYMLPLKLMEYLISGKPVLHVAQHPEDPTAQLVAGCPTFLCLYPPEVAQETDPFALFKSFLENLPHIGLDTAALEALRSRFSPEAVAHRYLHPSIY